MTCCPDPGKPTITGFLEFVRGIMGITPTVLPDNAPVVEVAFCASKATVLYQIQQVSPLMYNLAVYNLAGSNLINYAPDQTGQVYFANQRTLWNINSFAAGVVQSAADVSTSVSLLNPEFMKNLTLANLQQLKDPWGRAYLAIAQDSGTFWGIT